MEQIKSTLDKVFTQFQQKRVFNRDIAKALEAVLLKSEVRHLKFIACKNKICVVNVDTSNWLYCLNFKKETIKQALNKALGGDEKTPAVNDIKFRIGEV